MGKHDKTPLTSSEEYLHNRINDLEARIVFVNETNSKLKETPVTISGLVMGILVRFMTTLRILGLRLWMPTAATVPKAVATAVETTEITMELRSSCSRCAS